MEATPTAVTLATRRKLPGALPWTKTLSLTCVTSQHAVIKSHWLCCILPPFKYKPRRVNLVAHTLDCRPSPSYRSLAVSTGTSARPPPPPRSPCSLCLVGLLSRGTCQIANCSHSCSKGCFPRMSRRRNLLGTQVSQKQ